MSSNDINVCTLGGFEVNLEKILYSKKLCVTQSMGNEQHKEGGASEMGDQFNNHEVTTQNMVIKSVDPETKTRFPPNFTTKTWTIVNRYIREQFVMKGMDQVIPVDFTSFG